MINLKLQRLCSGQYTYTWSRHTLLLWISQLLQSCHKRSSLNLTVSQINPVHNALVLYKIELGTTCTCPEEFLSHYHGTVGQLDIYSFWQLI